MKRFSQRIGKTPVKDIIQIESIDQDLINGLWNGVHHFYLSKLEKVLLESCALSLQNLSLLVWVDFFREKVDEQPNRVEEFCNHIKIFFFSCEWFEVYDFLEFLMTSIPPDDPYGELDLSGFVQYCNLILKKELSGYRIIDGFVTPVTSKEEVSSIDEVIKKTNKFVSVRTHIQQALAHLSDRGSPDYRNSIKESICAVESLCKIITNNPKATLGKALTEIEKTTGLHKALKNSFSSLYGYTSDADGIRHALLDEDQLNQEDAIFMLVSCSAFINFLITKYSKIS